MRSTPGPSEATPPEPASSEPSRQPDVPVTTKQELVEVARALFSGHGYAATSLDAVVAGAEVTKGALYHHFEGKKELFRAVHQQVEADAVRRIEDAAAGVEDPWEAARAGLRAFLGTAREPGYRQVIIQDGPAVLGPAHVRVAERSTFATVRRLVAATLAAGAWTPPEPLLETFSVMVFGAMSSAGAAVATSTSPQEEADRVEAAAELLIAALRQISSGRVAPEDGQDPVPTLT